MRKSCGERMCSNYLHVFEDTLAFLVALFEALLCWRLFFCRGELLKEETVLSKGTLLDELNPPPDELFTRKFFVGCGVV